MANPYDYGDLDVRPAAAPGAPVPPSHVNNVYIKADHLKWLLSLAGFDADGNAGMQVSVASAVATSVNAKKGIFFDLRDQRFCWDYAAFRALERYTSWYAELGSFPVFGWIAINNGQTEVVIYDGRDGSAWMTFEAGGNNMLKNNADTSIVGVFFCDGCLYACSNTRGLSVIDFIRDSGRLYMTASYVYRGNVTQRNDALGFSNIPTFPVLVSNAVNAVAAIRDPQGSVDEFGRPKHIVAAYTNDGTSLSDAGITSFYDSALAGGIDMLDGIIKPSGNLFSMLTGASRDGLYWLKTVQAVSADAWDHSSDFWTAALSGSQDLPWTNGAVFSKVDAIEDASIVDGSSPVVLLSSDEGFALSHAKAGDNTNGLTFILNAVGNHPPYSSTVVDVWALEDATGLFGKDLTNNGSVTFASSVIGSGAVGDGTSRTLSRTGDADLNLGTGDFCIPVWVKTNTTVNSVDWIWRLDDGAAAIVDLRFLNVDGHVRFRVSDDNGASNDNVTFAQDLFDAAWHFLVCQRNGSTWELWVDGELVASAAVSNAAGSIDPTNLFLMGSSAASDYLDGMVDQFSIIKGRALSAAEIRLLHARGRMSIQAGPAIQILDAADVDYVRVSPCGSYAIFGNESKAYIMDPRHGIILATDGAPNSDNIQDAAIWSVPGGYSYVLFASDSIEPVQTNPVILEGMR
jgi:hypothetical protein